MIYNRFSELIDYEDSQTPKRAGIDAGNEATRPSFRADL